MSDLIFKTGDIVSIKSGGPPMTVEMVKASPRQFPSGRVACVWFDSNEQLHRDAFEADELVRWTKGKSFSELFRERPSDKPIPIP